MFGHVFLRHTLSLSQVVQSALYSLPGWLDLLCADCIRCLRVYTMFNHKIKPAIFRSLACTLQHICTRYESCSKQAVGIRALGSRFHCYCLLHPSGGGSAAPTRPAPPRPGRTSCSSCLYPLAPARHRATGSLRPRLRPCTSPHVPSYRAPLSPYNVQCAPLPPPLHPLPAPAYHAPRAAVPCAPAPVPPSDLRRVRAFQRGELCFCARAAAAIRAGTP